MLAEAPSWSLKFGMLIEASAAPCKVIVGSMVIGKATTVKNIDGRTIGLRPGI